MREREVIREHNEPVREREVVVDRPVDRGVVYDDRPRRGGGGGVVAAIIGILLLLLVAWFALQALGIMGDAADDAGNVNVEIPEEVNVDVDGG